MGQQFSQENNEREGDPIQSYPGGPLITDSQGRNGQRNGLAAFCCNTNLCNNDTNIDNKRTEINKRNRDRVGASGVFRTENFANQKQEFANHQMVNQKQLDQQFNEKGAFYSQHKDEYGNLLPMPLYGTGSVGESSNSGNGFNNQLFQDQHIKQQVKSALSLDTAQPKHQKQQSFKGHSPNNQFGDDEKEMDQMNFGLRPQAITAQQQLQDAILSNAEAMYEYKIRVAEFMDANPNFYNLKLEVVSSATLKKGDLITINPLGLFGNYISLREQATQAIVDQLDEIQQMISAPDTFTYFGSLPEVYDESENENIPERQNNNVGQQNAIIVNDFVIPPRIKESADQHRGRHFQIWFDTGLSYPNLAADDPFLQTVIGYYIKDLGVGFGAFKKLDVESNLQILTQAFGRAQVESMGMPTTGCLVLKDNMLINIGEAYIVVNLLPSHGVGDEGPHPTLKLKIFGGLNNGEVYEFNVKDMNLGQRDIVLGRTPECTIKINDKLLSKVQCHIKVQFEEGVHNQNKYRWMLHDGLKGKPSTNGTWLYINEDLKIYDGMVFKANQTIFTVTLES